MKKNLTRVPPPTLTGMHPGIRGTVSTGLCGDASGLRGNVTGLCGDVSGLSGDVTGLRGDVSGLRGNVDTCELTDTERAHGVAVSEMTVLTSFQTN